jgi:hypothetical protein
MSPNRWTKKPECMQKHLRGYDSVQLAAAHNLHEQLDLPLTFASYDRRLNRAALLLQLEVLS